MQVLVEEDSLFIIVTSRGKICSLNDNVKCKTHTTSFHFLYFQYSLKIQLHFLIDYYYLWLTAQICIHFTSVVIFVLIGYLGDDIISRMASVEIPFPSVVSVMFIYCHVIVYVQIEK